MSRNAFLQRFTVHAVGQGFFYSGRIEYGGTAFKFAFDCGSYHSNAIRREIDTFNNEVLKESNELDLLVISHFDEDHVNHIADLLRNVKRVKRLVLPFLDFEERLYLLLRIYERRTGRGSKGPAGISSEIAQLILDPTSYFSNYLDGDSEIYLIEHGEGPVGPIKDGSAVNNGIESEFRDENERPRNSASTFEINPKIVLGRSVLKTMKLTGTNAAMFQVFDTSPGSMSIRNQLLMEFIFYKRPLAHSEQKFYKLVAEEFKKVYKMTDLQPDIVLERVKEIKSATKLKKIFSDVAKECALPVSETANLNTTALCMLHRNLPESIRSILGEKYEEYLESYYFFVPGPVETHHHFEGHKLAYKQYYRDPTNWQWPLLYPNTLLTSDCFLKKNSDRKKFLEKYGPYLSEIWLIQIPHHGSEKNLTHDFIASSAYNARVSFFVNYGIQNRSGHPDELVLKWIQDAGRDRQLHLVNEWQGLAFELTMRDLD